MKKTLLVLSAVLLLVIVVFILSFEGASLKRTVWTVDNIESIDSEKLNQITATRSKSWREFLTLTYDSFSVPVYNESERQYLFCENLIDRVTVTGNIACSVAKVVDKASVLIIAWNDDSYKIYQIEKTTFPILSINTPAKSIAKKYREGFLIVFDNNAKEVQQFFIKIKKHGRSSNYYYPKKSMAFELIDPINGQDAYSEILGISKNSNFVLNSLYEDDSKIRDIVSLKVWENISDSCKGTVVSGIGMDMTEVFLDGSYWGVYGLQENVNTLSYFSDDSKEAAIFKVLTGEVPSGELSADSKNWGSVSLRGNSSGDSWALFQKFVAAVTNPSKAVFDSGVTLYLDIDNVIDYYLWVDIMYASDNIFKNLVFVETENRNGEKILEIVPWDSDLILGALWDTSADRNVRWQISFAESDLEKASGNTLLGLIWKNDTSGFRVCAAKRWFELRQGVLSEQNLLNLADTTFDEMTNSGARTREKLRWTESAYCSDNSFIDEFIRLRLSYLDSYYTEVLNGAMG